MTPRRRVGVLVSGSGSNLQALLDASRDPAYPAEIACVVSNRPNVRALARAEAAGVPTETVDHKAFSDRATFDAALDDRLRAHGVELVANAGFMRILTEGFVEAWRDRQLNIHPSLLPLFPGLNTHARALEAGVRLHGCTVHVVRAKMDSGPIVGQAAVPVHPDDTADSLAARVLAAEHKLYPACLALFAAGSAWIEGERCVIEAPAPDGALFSLNVERV